MGGVSQARVSRIEHERRSEGVRTESSRGGGIGGRGLAEAPCAAACAVERGWHLNLLRHRRVYQSAHGIGDARLVRDERVLQ
jgi:hypothetical protein